MAITKVVPAVIAVTNNITSNTFGSANTIPSFQVDGSGVIVAASNTAISLTANSVANNQFQTGSVENYMRANTLDFGMRNRIINGAMRIDQRNSGAANTVTTTLYTLDRWQATASQSSKYTVQQDSSANTVAGFTSSLKVTSLSSYSVGSGDYFSIAQRIEGNNIADLGFGTASAKSVTLSFWVRSSLTGTFGGAISNSSYARSYPYTYTISAANTWEQKFVTIPGDTSGTWLTTNGIGIIVEFGLGVGTTYSGTPGAWASGSGFDSATGAVSVVGTNGATWYITGVQFEEGSVPTPFEYRQYGIELTLCQRYYQSISGGIGVVYEAASMSFSVPYKVTMRAAPTASVPSGTITVDRASSGAFTSSGSYIAGSNIQKDAASLNVTGWSGLTVGWAPLIYQSASWVNFSSEL